MGRALRHDLQQPVAPVDGGSLAAETGVSRAALARRFTELVGEPPMTFLTGWRLALAADLLREPGATIGAVAARSATAAPSRSAPPSSACVASAPNSTEWVPITAFGPRNGRPRRSGPAGRPVWVRPFVINHSGPAPTIGAHRRRRPG